MTLAVLSVAYPLSPVGPDAVGGAEQILTFLDAALVEAGHQSLVVACEGSTTRGTLFPVRFSDWPLDEALAWVYERQLNTINQILNDYHVDLVHMHGLNFAKCLPQRDVPVLVTLHMPPSYYPPESFSVTRPRTFLHCVSSSQQRSCPPNARLLDPIENGVPFVGARVPTATRKFCLALGRICPEKGFHFAIEAAERAGTPLVLGGPVFNFKTYQKYFDEEIAPRCHGGIRFIGPVNKRRKRRLLSAAKCVLIPSVVPETSSLVAMEAFASGTPVIAFRSGALAEIVEDGRTGFLVNDENEMADAIKEVGQLDIQACFEVARTRFSVERMAERYLDLYKLLTTDHTDTKRRRDLRSPRLKIRELTILDELEALRPQWLELWRRSSTATPFQSPAWIIPWWKHFGSGRLCALAVNDGQRLVALAPFFVANIEGRRHLVLSGTGNTDYLDVLFEDEVRRDAASLLSNYLCQNRGSWDQCDLQNLRRESVLLKLRTCASRLDDVQQQDVCPRLSLTTVEEFVNGLPHRLQKNIAYYERKLSELGVVTFERAGEHNFDELFAAFVQLHGLRWQMNQMSGVLSDRNVQDFNREAARGFLSIGALRLYGLRVDDRIVASLYAFHHRERTYYYLGGFDPEFKQYSPGTLLLSHAIKDAISERAKEFDFLRGREDYKYRWGATDTIIYRKRLG